MTRLIILSSALLITLNAEAQKDKDTTANRDLVFVDSYKPKLMEAQKIESVPVIEKPSIKPIAFNYKIKSHQINTEKIVNPIPVAELGKSEETIYPTSFIKLGYGNYNTLLGEIYLNNKQSKQYSYGLNYRHLGSNSNPKGDPDLNQSFADFSNHTFKGYASTYTDIGELGMDINYKYNKYNFYGFDTSNHEAKNHLGRVVNNLDARAYFNSTAISNKKLKHRTQFNFYNFGIDKMKESQYALNSKLYGNIPDFGELKHVLLSGTVGFDYNVFKNDTLQAIKRLFVQIDPRMDFEYEGMQMTVGFNTTLFFNGTDSAIPFVNPVIKASYPIIEGVANLYAGIDGRYHKQSLRSIMLSNPFTTRFDLVNMYENAKAYIGLNAKLGASADALFELNYSDVSNMPLYVSINNPGVNPTNEKDSLNSFAVHYRQVNILKFTGAFNYSFSESVRIGFIGNFYDYSVEGQPEAWQLPNSDARLNMRFNIKDKVYPHFDLMAMGIQKQRSGVFDKTNTGAVAYNSSSLKAFYDLSAGIDFRFKKKLSAFVQANNMLNNRYQRWYNYKVYGFNIVGGITMIF